MDTVNPQCRVRQCFKCPGDATYFCCTCNADLCLRCKEKHCSDLKSFDHHIVINREKYKHFLKKTLCKSHPHNICGLYCKLCELSVCFKCLEHKDHQMLDLRTAYESMRHQYNRQIDIIKSRTIPYSLGLLAAVLADIKIWQTEVSRKISEVLQKGQRLNCHLDNMLRFVDLKHRCLKQKRDINRTFAIIQRYICMYEQSNIFPKRFLLFIKKTSKPRILDSMHLKRHTCQLSMNESINENMIESLHEIHFTGRRKRLIGSERLLKLMPVPELHHSLTLAGFNGCLHMSFATTDMIWVKNRTNLIMTNMTGKKIHHVKNVCDIARTGIHTVNGNNELIYINSDFDIVKLSNDMKQTFLLISPRNLNCLPLCVYWSQSTGDLLVGTHTKVIRYNQATNPTKTIKHTNLGQEIYRHPCYITENNNGNVIVSDPFRGVVVTERGGSHRFTYSGYPSRSLIDPGGICTDALSHILVCDLRNDTVHMINGDGQFLSYLLIRPTGIFRPQSLLYDKETHRLWVGSANKNKVNVYRYITQRSTWTCKSFIRVCDLKKNR